eukprot:m.355192 g.355192  ORF g.355192 m.355192 type:complete len:106 (+) comp55942_c0_seq6:579-896(+)
MPSISVPITVSHRTQHTRWLSNALLHSVTTSRPGSAWFSSAPASWASAPRSHPCFPVASTSLPPLAPFARGGPEYRPLQVVCAPSAGVCTPVCAGPAGSSTQRDQ